MDDIKKIDIYELLEVESDATEQEVSNFEWEILKNSNFFLFWINFSD